jgi:hypothetical protein
MNMDYNRLLQEMEEEVEGYNDTVYNAIADDLEQIIDNLGDKYHFTGDVKSGDAAQDVYDWVRKNDPETLEEWLKDPELVVGHDSVWHALEALKKVQDWSEFDEEDALGMDIRDYEHWKASRGDPTEESVCEGIATTRKTYLQTGKIDQEVFDAIKEADPTEKKKYMDWMAKAALINNGSPAKGKSVADMILRSYAPIISQFEEMVERGIVPKEQRDIYKIKDFSDLKRIVTSLEGRETKTQQKKRVKEEGADKVLDDYKFKVYEIHSFEASQQYGSHTKWCITSYDGKYWTDYSQQGIYFYFVILQDDIWMTENLEEDPDSDMDDDEDWFGSEGSKYAIAFQGGLRDYEVYDEEDDKLPSSTADWLVETLMDRGADFASSQPDEVQEENEEFYERQREQWYEDWWTNSTANASNVLYRHWDDPDEEMELDGESVTFTEEYLEKLEDDSDALAEEFVQAAREWSEGASWNDNSDENKSKRRVYGQFEEAGDEEGGELYLEDEDIIYVLEYMGYLEPVTSDKSLEKVMKFIADYEEQPQMVDDRSEVWDRLRRILTDSEYSDLKPAKLRSMDREELIAAAKDAVKQWKEDVGRRDVQGQRKFDFAAERRLMSDMFGMEL